MENQNGEVVELAAAVAKGFANSEALITALSEKFNFVDRKLDNRFDLLERMMFENRRHDNDVLKELETRVSKLEAVA